MLFDLEADPLEQHEVSRSNPSVVESLMGKLQVRLSTLSSNRPTRPAPACSMFPVFAQTSSDRHVRFGFVRQAFNATKIQQDNAPIDPRSSPAHFNDTWTPWEGDPDPSKCARPPLPPPPACENGELRCA
jgi:hypothetical protein